MRSLCTHISVLAALSLSVAVFSGFSGFATAKPAYVSRIPNGASIHGIAALGHVDPAGGGARNAFGEAFEKAGHVWTVALCLEDSDGDGATNGQELGDPCCVWHQDQFPTFTNGTSHPGNASSTVDKTMLLQWICGYHSSQSFAGSDASSDGATPASSHPAASGSDPTSRTMNATSVTSSPPISSSAHHWGDCGWAIIVLTVVLTAAIGGF